MKRIVVLMIGCLEIASFIGCSSPEEKTKKLFTKASQLVLSAQETEKTSYADAFTLYQEALATAEGITPRYPSSQVARKLIRGEARVGPYTMIELRDTVVYRARMRAEAEENPLACALLVAETITEDVSSRASIIAEIASMYDDAGQPEQVLQIARATRDAESKGRVLSEMISKYLGNRQYDQALQIANAIDDASLKDWALGWITRALLEADQYEQALQVASKMKVAHSRAWALAGIASKCAKVGEKKKAEETLSQALQIIKTVEDSCLRTNGLAQISRVYTEAGRYDQAIQITEMIEDRLVKGDVLAEVTRGYTETQQYDQAFKVASVIEDNFAKYKALSAIADKWAEVGQKDQAAGVLSHALQVVDATEEGALKSRRMSLSRKCRSPVETIIPGQVVSFKIRALAEIAGKYAEVGQTEKALKILSRLERTEPTGTYPPGAVLAAIANAYSKAGQYDQALEIANKIVDSNLRSEALTNIARGYAEAGQQGKVAEILSQVDQAEQERRQTEQMEQERWQDDGYAEDRELSATAHQYAEAGQYDQALKVAQTIQEGFFKDQALAAIAGRYTEAGQYDQALEVAKTMADSSVKANVLTEIAFWYAAAGAQEKASQIVSQVFQIAQTRENISSKGEVLAAVARALAAAGFRYAKAGRKVNASIEKVLHEIIAGLDERAWSEQPSEAEGQKVVEPEWGLWGARQPPDGFYFRGPVPGRE